MKNETITVRVEVITTIRTVFFITVAISGVRHSSM